MTNSIRNVGNTSVGSPQFFLPTDAAHIGSSYYNAHTVEHWELLQRNFSNADAARPLIFMTILPYKEPSQGSSEYNNIAMQRYNQIEHDLTQIAGASLEEGGVEEGAVNTARSLVRQLRSRELAPPELSWVGNEAIIMLWAIGEQRLALTITDGEYAYTLRHKRETVGRASGIKPDNFDLLRLK